MRNGNRFMGWRCLYVLVLGEVVMMEGRWFGIELGGLVMSLSRSLSQAQSTERHCLSVWEKKSCFPLLIFVGGRRGNHGSISLLLKQSSHPTCANKFTHSTARKQCPCIIVASPFPHCLLIPDLIVSNSSNRCLTVHEEFITAISQETASTFFQTLLTLIAHAFAVPVAFFGTLESIQVRPNRLLFCWQSTIFNSAAVANKSHCWIFRFYGFRILVLLQFFIATRYRYC